MSLLLAWVLVASPASADVTEPVGTFGGTLELADGWRRQTLVPALGPDQFQSADGYVIVQELRGTYLDAQDMRRLMGMVAQGLAEKNGTPASQVVVDQKGGVLHAQQEWHVNEGTPMVGQMHLLARGGLGYVAWAFAPQTDAAGLRRFSKQIPRRLHLPEPGSAAWTRVTEPVVTENEIEGHRVRFAWSPEFFVDAELSKEADPFAGLTTKDVNIRVYLLAEYAPEGQESLLDQAIEKAGGVDHVERFDGTVDGRAARLATFEGRATDSPLSGAVAIVPLGDDLYLDVRFITYAGFTSRRPLWEGLLGSVDIEDLPRVDAFPVVERLSDAARLSVGQRAFLEGVSFLGEVGHGQAWRLIGDDLYVQTWEDLRVVSLADGTSREVDVGDAEHPGLPVVRSDGLYVPTGGGAVVRVVDGKAGPAELEAVELADAGALGLLVVRGAETRHVPGYGDIRAPSGQRVLLRAPSGEERLLVELGRRVVRGMAVREGQAILALEDPDASAWGLRDLVALDLEKIDLRPLGTWPSIASLAATPDGWLVTGTPPDLPSGVYRLAAGGERTLLVSGAHGAAFPAAPGDLYLVTRWRPPGVPLGADANVALRVPTAVAAAHGPRFDPFTDARVQQVAHAALAALGLSADPNRVLADPASIRRFVAAADRDSTVRIGVPLPRDAAGVDRLLAGGTGGQHLGEDGSLLLTALLADHLLAEGAVWAEGRASARLVDRGALAGVDNAHAQGFLPMEIVRSVRQDDEGWWEPATAIASRRDGRAIVLGLDPAAVRAEVAGRARPGLDEIARIGDVPAIVAWLSVEPENVFLRGRAYALLAAAGRERELVDVAAPFLAGGAFEDRRASLAGRVARGVDAHPALVSDLRTAIAEFPDEAALYMMLGHVYEHGADPAAPLLAAACYRHVTDALRWSPFRPEATAALGRLEP